MKITLPHKVLLRKEVFECVESYLDETVQPSRKMSYREMIGAIELFIIEWIRFIFPSTFKQEDFALYADGKMSERYWILFLETTAWTIDISPALIGKKIYKEEYVRIDPMPLEVFVLFLRSKG